MSEARQAVGVVVTVETAVVYGNRRDNRRTRAVLQARLRARRGAAVHTNRAKCYQRDVVAQTRGKIAQREKGGVASATRNAQCYTHRCSRAPRQQVPSCDRNVKVFAAHTGGVVGWGKMCGNKGKVGGKVVVVGEGGGKGARGWGQWWGWGCTGGNHWG